MKRPLRLGEGMQTEQGWHATDCQPIVSRRSIRVRQIHKRSKTLRILVGATGFEPATPCAQGRHTPPPPSRSSLPNPAHPATLSPPPFWSTVPPCTCRPAATPSSRTWPRPPSFLSPSSPAPHRHHRQRPRLLPTSGPPTPDRPA